MTIAKIWLVNYTFTIFPLVNGYDENTDACAGEKKGFFVRIQIMTDQSTTKTLKFLRSFMKKYLEM